MRNAGRAASGADDVSRELGADDCGECGRVGGLTVKDTGVDMVVFCRTNNKVDSKNTRKTSSTCYLTELDTLPPGKGFGGTSAIYILSTIQSLVGGLSVTATTAFPMAVITRPS